MFVSPLLILWQNSISHMPSLVPTVMRTVLPLVQQLQAYSPQLLAAAEAAAPAAQLAAVNQELVNVQRGLAPALLRLLESSFWMTVPVNSPLQEQKDSLMQHPAVAELLLQGLTTCTAQLHKRHVAHQQQQQQQQLKQQVRADLLPIPAFHQDMLQLLPGAQAYLDAAAAAAAANCNRHEQYSCSEVDLQLWLTGGSCCAAMHLMLCHHISTSAVKQQDPMLSAAAVRMVLELQLLSASEHQRQRLEQQDKASVAVFDFLVMNSRRLLHTLIEASAQASGSCLPPEVLQQAGLQLLQALAAPLQQLHLVDEVSLLERVLSTPSTEARGHMGRACNALVTAACGPASQGVVGGLQGTAAQQQQQCHMVCASDVIAASIDLASCCKLSMNSSSALSPGPIAGNCCTL
jgi:hypothetical protein